MRYQYLIVVLVLLTGVHLVQGDIRSVPPGGTVFIGEEQLDISTTGIGPGTQIAWWAPGTSLIETPADVIMVGDPTQFSVLRSSFSGKEGIWYSVGEKTPVFHVKQPRLRLKISDTTSVFDATGKWIPRGNIASFQIETNLYELRSRAGVSGAPVDIRIRTPLGGELSAVSGPTGPFSLTGIPVHSALYDTGGVWYTRDADPGTYVLQAECTANRLNSNNPQSGAGVSEEITVLIQDVNPLITAAKQRESEPKPESNQTIIPDEPEQPAIKAPQTGTEQTIPQTTTPPVTVPGVNTPVDQDNQSSALPSPEPPESASQPTPTPPDLKVDPVQSVPPPTPATPLPVILVIFALICSVIRFR